MFGLGQIQTILVTQCGLDPQRPVLMGVSGGPDSLCLLDVMVKTGWKVCVAHLNHRLRSEADEEARFVEMTAQRRGLLFLGEEADVGSYAREHGLSLEEAARILRYDFLFRAAASNHAQAVAVAHTADDQVETILMHLLRGAGLAGLRGMVVRTIPNPWSRVIPLIRPMLATWRSDVLAYCAAEQIPFVQDESNLDPSFFRNRLRHDLIPLLETYNPQMRRNLLHTSQVLQADYSLIEEMLAQAWQTCQVESLSGSIRFSTSPFMRLPLGMQRHLLRRVIAELRPGLRDIDFALIERALTLIHHPSRSRQADLAAGLNLLSENENTWIFERQHGIPFSISKSYPQLEPGQRLILPVPGYLEIGTRELKDGSKVAGMQGGWILRAQIQEAALAASHQFQDGVGNELAAVPEQVDWQSLDPFQAWLDADCVPTPLEVRSRQPGDMIQPLGMGGKRVKISDLMINEKIPGQARIHWPLICSGDIILWVPGLRVSEAARITPETRRVILLTMKRLLS
jgi:tRNA(Ile)-lysidine synthase